MEDYKKQVEAVLFASGKFLELNKISEYIYYLMLVDKVALSYLLGLINFINCLCKLNGLKVWDTNF